jgi:hypothetical protein
MSERTIQIEEARTKALNIIEDEGDHRSGLAYAVALFYGELHGRIDPPIHHADITQGILLAQDADKDGVRKWLEKF